MFARSLLAVVVLLSLVGTAGCGDDGHSGVAPKQWASTVCGALSPWRVKISELTTKTQEQMGATKTAPKTKTNIIGLLAGAESASEEARAGVSRAGVPAVKRGEQIAQQFTRSLEKARDAYGNARKTIDGLSTGDSRKFYDGVTTAFDTLNREYAASALDTEHVGDRVLQKAFDEVPECR